MAPRDGEPLTVELVGLIPDLYKLCPTRCDWASAGEVAADGEQLRDYPEEARRAAAEAAALWERLVREFAGRVRPVSVGYLSPRGIWLSLRHRLRTGEVYAVVAGRAVPAAAGYEAVRAAVLEALAARARPA